MTYNVFGGTLNPTLLLSIFQHFLNIFFDCVQDLYAYTKCNCMGLIAWKC